VTCSRAATSLFDKPSAHPNTIRDRNANACDDVRRRDHLLSCSRSSPVSSSSAFGLPVLGITNHTTSRTNLRRTTLGRAGVAPDDVYLDRASGAKASRSQLDLLVRHLRAGDTLVVTRLDRLGRSVLHLVTLGAALRERGVQLRVLEQGIDTATAEGRAMSGMLSVLAELQRELIVANTRDGLAAARARGRTGGRRP